MINPSRPFTVFAYLSISQTVLFPFTAVPPPQPLRYITFNWIPAMKFHPRRSLVVLSEEPPPISQPPFIPGFSFSDSHAPSCIVSVPVSISDRIASPSSSHELRQYWIKGVAVATLQEVTRKKRAARLVSETRGSRVWNNSHFPWKPCLRVWNGNQRNTPHTDSDCLCVLSTCRYNGCIQRKYRHTYLLREYLRLFV